jgi:hypothetical protein
VTFGRVIRAGAVATALLVAACGAVSGEKQPAPQGFAGGAGSASAGASAGSGSGSGGMSAGNAGRPTVEPPPEGGAANECRRDVTFAAVVLGEPAPFDLIVVADHSGSLAWSRDELASGLSNLLLNVRGRSVRVFVVTPTQYGASSAAAQAPLTGESIVAWKDAASGEAFENAVTRYEQSCTSPEGQPIDCPSPLGPTPYRVQGSWEFESPAPVAVLTPEMTDMQFADEQAAVAERILAIGGSGSPEEQPLCTLSRYVSQPADLLPRNVVFLVISDEDDVSTPRDCLAGFAGELRVVQNQGTPTACSAECDAYRFSVTGNANSKAFQFECEAFDDLGNPIPGTKESRQATQGTLPTCEDFVTGPCMPDEAQTIGFFCDAGAVLTACQRECSPVERTCSVDVTDASLDPCTGAFVANGTTYADIFDYCADMGTDFRDCRGAGLNFEVSTSMSGSTAPRPLMSGTTTADVGRYFRARADSAFTANGYLLEAIVFAPEFSCQLEAGQSHATNLSQVVGSSSRIFSLCDSYAPALDGVLGFAQALIQTEFSVALKEDEQVSAVRVVAKDGSERNLLPTQFEYDAAAGTLRIDPTALRETDASLNVEITSDCRPIVR